MGRQERNTGGRYPRIVSESTCELMRLRSTIYADTSAVDRKKSPRERRNGGKRNTRVYERRQNCGRGLKLKKGRRKRVRLSLSFRVKRVKNRGGDTFILGALGLYPLKRLAQNNVEKHIRSLYGSSEVVASNDNHAWKNPSNAKYFTCTLSMRVFIEA